MSEWKEYRIGDLVTLQRGHDLVQTEFSEGIYVVAGSNGPIGFHNKFTTNGPGITLGRSGNSIGVAHYYKDNFWAHNTVLYVKEFHNSIPKFVYYLFKSLDLKFFDAGSAVPTLNRNHVHPVIIKVPTDLNEQSAIAEVLSSLDDKIDLLHRQNKTLEHIAETLFRQWFVAEAEEEWGEKSLKEIATHHKEGINPSNYPDTFFQHYSLPAFDEGKSPKSEIGKDILSNKYRVIPNSILISKLNPRFPRVWELYGDYIPGNAICSTEFQVVKPKDLIYFGFIFCFLKSNQVMQELANAAGGTSGSHQRVTPNDIFGLSFLTPPNEKLMQFDHLTKDYFQKMKSNAQYIKILTRLRDNLLPKLMSGEVRVKY